MGIRLFVFCVLGMLFTNMAHAAPPACNAGSEGTIVYNKDQKLVQFCNGTNWVGMIAKIGGAGDTLSDLTCQSGEVPQWNGTAWVCGAGGTGLWTDSGNGYLTYTGTDTGIKVQAITGMSAPTNTLADLGCANNEILKWDGTVWGCAADATGSLADNSVTNAKMADDAVGIAELSATGTASATTYLRGDNTWATISTGLPALTSASIWVGNGTNVATAVAMSGDATMNNAGLLTIGSNAIGSGEITDATVALADLAANSVDAGKIVDASVTGADIANTTIVVGKLSATGTASATTYLRGDGQWAAVTGDNLGAGGSTSGRIISTGGSTVSEAMATATGGGAFEARSVGSAGTAGAAYMAFHRPSAYAAYFGLDTDNQWKVGGWSMGANSYKVWHQGNDGTGSGLDADTIDGLDSAALLAGDNLGAGGSTTGGITMNNGSPTITFQDTDHRTGFIHQNSNLMYFLTSAANNATTWAVNGAHWPMYINMTNDDVVLGGNLILNEGGIFLNNGGLNLGTQGISGSAGPVLDAGGGWVRTYGPTGWYNGTYGGGWHMTDTTWIRSYNGKWVYTDTGLRADGNGVRTTQVCDVNGANCRTPAQLASGGGGSALPGTFCGMRGAQCGDYQEPMSYTWESIPCNGTPLTGDCENISGVGYWERITSCPAGYTGMRYNVIYGVGNIFTCVKQ